MFLENDFLVVDVSKDKKLITYITIYKDLRPVLNCYTKKVANEAYKLFGKSFIYLKNSKIISNEEFLILKNKEVE